MAERKNLCAMVPIELHDQGTEVRECLGQTISEYITAALTEYFKMKQNGGKTIMTNNRTMAFQISEELFQRIKAHLERETARTGKKLTQREFVLGLIEAALDEAEQALATEAPSSPCEAPEVPDSTLSQEETNEASLDSVQAV